MLARVTFEMELTSFGEITLDVLAFGVLMSWHQIDLVELDDDAVPFLVGLNEEPVPANAAKPRGELS